MKSGIVPKPSRRLALALLALVTWSAASIDCAFVIKASDVHAPATDLGKSQTLEKTWNVSGPSGLHNLLIQAPGSVYVDYDASLDSNDLVAKVVVTGNSEALINAFKVLSWDEPTGEGLELHLQPGVGDFQDHVLAHILIGDKQALQSIKSLSSAAVVISDNVLASNNASASVELSALGPGIVTVVSTQELVVDTLSILAAAGGSVVVQAPSIDVTNSITVDSVGSGDIAIIADSEIKANAVTVKSVGSGDTYIQATNIVTSTINTLVSGSGNVTFSSGGSCVSQSVRLLGNGSFMSGSIVSEAVLMGIYGSGNALVQATDKLEATITGSGELYYVDAAPKEVVVHGRPWSLRGSSRKNVQQAWQNEFHTFTPRVQGHERIPTLVITSADRLETQILDARGLPFSDLSSMEYLEVFLCILVGVGAMLKYRKRRLRDRLLRRNQYTPLVVVTAAIEGIVALLASNANRNAR